MYVIAGALLMGYLSCNPPGNKTTMQGTTMKDAEGIWQQASEVKAETAPGQHLSDTYTFQYAQGHVTMALLAISKFKGTSDDGFYLLDSRWEGNKLLIRFPNGDWDELATFQNGHFEQYGDGLRREYARITPDQVAPFSKGILKADRELYDYSWLEK